MAAIYKKEFKNVVAGNKTIEDALKDVESSYQTICSKNWGISMFKKQFKDAGMMKESNFIQSSQITKDVIEASLIQQEDRRLINVEKPFYVDPFFNKELVLARIDMYLATKKVREWCDLPFFCDMLIAFCARPSELKNLRISPCGYTTGFGKNPKNSRRKFRGLVDVDMSRKLFELINFEGRLLLGTVRGLVYKTYNMQLKQFRPLGAMYIAQSIKAMGAKRIAIQQALRHSVPGTSIMYYDIKLVTHDLAFKMKQEHKKGVGAASDDADDDSSDYGAEAEVS